MIVVTLIVFFSEMSPFNNEHENNTKMSFFILVTNNFLSHLYHMYEIFMRIYFQELAHPTHTDADILQFPKWSIQADTCTNVFK